MSGSSTGTVQEIPLSATPQTLSITLGGVNYNLKVMYRNAANGQGGWTLDIADASSNPIVCGIPLVTGANLLEQYGYLGFPGELWVATDGNPTDAPTFENLGTLSHLYFLTPVQS
jgi:hypothetical protein